MMEYIKYKLPKKQPKDLKKIISEHNIDTMIISETTLQTDTTWRFLNINYTIRNT